jgi:hypothetical protein
MNKETESNKKEVIGTEESQNGGTYSIQISNGVAEQYGKSKSLQLSEGGTQFSNGGYLQYMNNHTTFSKQKSPGDIVQISTDKTIQVVQSYATQLGIDGSLIQISDHLVKQICNNYSLQKTKYDSTQLGESFCIQVAEGQTTQVAHYKSIQISRGPGGIQQCRYECFQKGEEGTVQLVGNCSRIVPKIMSGKWYYADGKSWIPVEHPKFLDKLNKFEEWQDEINEDTETSEELFSKLNDVPNIFYLWEKYG